MKLFNYSLLTSLSLVFTCVFSINFLAMPQLGAMDVMFEKGDIFEKGGCSSGWGPNDCVVIDDVNIGKVFGDAALSFIKAVEHNDIDATKLHYGALNLHGQPRMWLMSAAMYVAMEWGALDVFVYLVNLEGVEVGPNHLVQIMRKLADRIYCISEQSGDVDKIKEAIAKYSSWAKIIIGRLSRAQINAKVHVIKNRTLLMEAVRYGFSEILQDLVNAGALIDVNSDEIKTALAHPYDELFAFIESSFISLRTFEKCREILLRIGK